MPNSLKTRIELHINHSFHALTHRAFLYFWAGQTLSNIGTWMQTVALSWMVLSLTNSPLMLGFCSLMQFIPAVFLTIVAGALSDAFSNRIILIITNTLLTLICLTFAFLSFSGAAKLYVIFALSFLTGCVNSFDMPARQVFALETAGKNDLPNAVSLNTASFNLARLLGPAAAGIVMSAAGAGWCFIINAASFIPVIAALFAIKPLLNSAPDHKKTARAAADLTGDIRDGLGYIRRNGILLFLLSLSAAVALFANNFQVLLPVFAKQVYHFHALGFGYLMSALGAGALFGALLMPLLGKGGTHRHMPLYASLLLALVLLFTGFSKVFLLTAVGAGLTGFFLILFNTASNSMLQLNSDDVHRGRVMGVYSLIIQAFMPLGNFFAGIAANRLGAPNTFVLSGAVCLAAATVIPALFRKKKTAS